MWYQIEFETERKGSQKCEVGGESQDNALNKVGAIIKNGKIKIKGDLGYNYLRAKRARPETIKIKEIEADGQPTKPPANTHPWPPPQKEAEVAA